MDSVPYLAKPSGVTLVDHTRHLREQLEQHILPDLPERKFLREKYAKRTGDDLLALTLQAIRWHDAGKKHPVWQNACCKDYAIWKVWHDNGRKGKEPDGINLQRAGIRHEMASLHRMLTQNPNISNLIKVAVAAHHGKLGHRHLERWTNDVNGVFAHLWPPFVGLSDEVDYTCDFDKAVNLRYAYAGPRALLQLADHRASAQEDADIRRNGVELPTFEPFSYTFPSKWTKRGPQKIVPELWDEHLALLRAPTGAGKTDAALLWAQHQIKSGRADRLVIAMPTRFTANALAITTAETLGSAGLYHSSAWYQRLKQSEGLPLKVRRQIDAEQEMARLLETPITVTTIDHLCISLSGAREDHHAIFFNLAHSCVVIDEADFYDDFTQANLVLLLRTLRLLDVYVLLMSATLPVSACELYSAPKIHEDVEDKDRIRCQLKRHSPPVVQPTDIEELLKPALEGKPTIIYANTVQRAQRYYRWFLKNKMNPKDIILYHSRFREPDKIQIEERLRSMLGKEAWETEEKGGTPVRGVAILTQIGELSVNISANYMLSELCPLDRLVQRVGRLARFTKQPGELCLLLPHKLMKDGNVQPYPAPYGSYKQGTGWIASPALKTSAQMLQRYDEYSSQMFVDLVNEHYKEMPKMDPHVRANQEALRFMMGMNWLLLPGGQISPEADETRIGTTQWKCRDIDPQTTVLVGLNTFAQFDEGMSLPNRRDWRRLVQEHGISCYAYEFQCAEKQGCLEKRVIAVGEGRDDTEEAWLVRDQFYDARLGLCFDDPEEDP